MPRAALDLRAAERAPPVENATVFSIQYGDRRRMTCK